MNKDQEKIESVSQYYTSRPSGVSNIIVSTRANKKARNFNPSPWEGLVGDGWKRLNNQASDFLVSVAENLMGETLYAKVDYSIDDDVDDNLKSFARRLTEDGILKDLQYKINYNDEPKFFTFSGYNGDLLKTSDSGGSSWGGASGCSLKGRNEALIKCLGEITERACNAFYKKGDFVISSFRDLKNKKINAINPVDFVSFTDKQVADFPYLGKRRIKDDSILKWVWGKSLITGKKILIPAQTVYVPYKYDDNEAVIRSQITTGAAIYTDSSEAIYRGLCEVIERDAFMIAYLNMLPLPIVDLENSFSGELKWIVKLFKRYNLELYVLDATSDIHIPTFAILIIDRTGIGPAVTTGNKCGFDSKDSILGSIEEALKVRAWSRYHMADKEAVLEAKKNFKAMRIQEQRCLFWSTIDMIDKISPFLKGPKKIINSFDYKKEKKLDAAIELIKKAGLEPFAVDITMPQAKKYNLVAYMVLIPQAQPLYLWEEQKCINGQRLYEVPVKLGYFDKPKKEEELNLVPHPFP